MTESPHISTLENGITLVTQRIPGSRQAIAHLSVDVGAKDEGKNKAGMSHFLEHMLTADTKRYTVEEAATRLQEMRGTSDASTDYNTTDYTYQVGNEHAAEAVQLLADGVLRATFTPERFEQERSSIRQEWMLDPQHGKDEMLQIAFPGTDMDKEVDGTLKQLDKRSREDLIAFRDRHYTGDRMVLTVVGDIDHETIKAVAEKEFAGLQKTAESQRKAQAPLTYRGGMSIDLDEYTEQASLSFTFEASDERDPKGVMLDAILATALGDGFSSRLLKRLRNETGIAYSPDVSVDHYRGSGLLTIQTDAPAERAPEAVDIICKELKDFPDTLNEQELHQVKAALIGGMERQEQDMQTLVYRLTDAARSGHSVQSLDDQIALLESLTLDDVREHARQRFTSPPTILAEVNPDYPIPPYKQITAMLGHERKLDMTGLLKLEEDCPSTDRSLRGAEVAAQPKRQLQRAI